MPTITMTLEQQQQQQQQQQQDSIELFLSVPGGLEDVAVRKLPSLLLDTATHILYQIGSGYISLRFGPFTSASDNNNGNNEGHSGGGGNTGGNGYTSGSRHCTTASEDRINDNSNTGSIAKVIADLIEHPPLCIFAAYVSIGEISIPRSLLFDSPPKDCLDYCMNGFAYPATTTMASTGGDLGLRWQQGLSVLQFSPSTLSESLATFPSPAVAELAAPLYSAETTESSLDNSNDDDSDSGARPPVRYRASFDRGDVQHKGIRSQDLAAALGGLTGDTFPSWKVNLKEYDVEIMGRWIQEELEEVQYKPEVFPVRGEEIKGADSSNKRPRIEQRTQQQQRSQGEFVRMQVGMTLPLALSICPYRFRPLDGRTSLRIEIAYTLLALADPKPGDVVVDTCSGVGTIPIVGAVHYPKSWFTGLEVLPYNVERAAQNAAEMTEKVDHYRQQERTVTSETAVEFGAGTSTGSIFRCLNSHRPSLIVGDARAVCWRPGSVDLVISDLPWGKRENSHVYNCKLYPRLIREIIRLLRVNGRAVLITGERKLLQRQLDAPFARPFLKVLQRREITIGYKVMVYELLRT
ncbi:MAG: hypothetical protein J3R72DRAFT_440233 [Linnemannia gamsii]|nr:MAG: hypothetical protein J3R72DRAFT_440233 [Linnemannia gamsii]